MYLEAVASMQTTVSMLWPYRQSFLRVTKGFTSVSVKLYRRELGLRRH